MDDLPVREGPAVVVGIHIDPDTGTAPTISLSNQNRHLAVLEFDRLLAVEIDLVPCFEPLPPKLADSLVPPVDVLEARDARGCRIPDDVVSVEVERRVVVPRPKALVQSPHDLDVLPPHTASIGPGGNC